MTRLDVEQYLGKQVVVILWSGDDYTGELHKTRDKSCEGDMNLMIPKNYYFCAGSNTIFRCSHIRRILEVTHAIEK